MKIVNIGKKIFLGHCNSGVLLNDNIIGKSEKIINLADNPVSYYNKIMVENVQSVQEFASRHTEDNYKSCLLGGAIGDALGWPVEFIRLSTIKSKYGQNGITDLKIYKNGLSEITDDTQMTIFTADGLLKSAIKNFDENEIPDMSIVYESYQNWLKTQGYGKNNKPVIGWIANIQDLYADRAPGNTCLGSLISKKPGSVANPINNSEGCGGVMRVAPAGLMYYQNPELAFRVGAECAALTHGHPNAYLAAGVHSSIIARIIKGESLLSAVDESIKTLKHYKGSEKLVRLLEEAKNLAKSDINPEDAIYKLGEGWHGDEAIAISTYCALKEPNDFRKALIMAVNHNGDSDSTGAITGNILGAYLGSEKIPAEWIKSIELSKELKQLATDLYCKPCEIKNKFERYPI